MKLPLHIEWSGTFTKGDNRQTRKLSFDCNSEDAARDVIAGYVEAMEGKGWKLISNSVSIRNN